MTQAAHKILDEISPAAQELVLGFGCSLQKKWLRCSAWTKEPC